MKLYYKLIILNIRRLNIYDALQALVKIDRVNQFDTLIFHYMKSFDWRFNYNLTT